MADRTLTINHADGGSETYTINRDKFAGVREMQIDGAAVAVDHTAVPKHQSKETTLGGSQSITVKRDIEPLLSKVVGGAAAAYSLRDLHDTTGVNKVVRVRRTSDNFEDDFTASEVANGTLTTWVGAGNDGFVETWYDQSGNGNNATQLTAGNQPKIVNAGVLVTGGLTFDGVNDTFDLTTTIPVSSGSLFTVLNLSTGKTLQSLYGNVAGDKLYLPLAQSGGTATQTSVGATITSPFVNSSSANWTTRGDVFSSIVTNTQRLVTMQGVSTTVDVARVGGGGNDDWYVDGSIQEVIIYPSDQTANRLAIEANINNQYDIY